MRRRFSQQGFTLIELIVVIAILAVLMLIVILVLNPLKQLNKVEDVQRVHDLSTIATALDGYYNDNNSYPQSISFGQTWSGSNTTYMEKVPQDPQESSNGSYCYLNDGSSNSQWNVLFAKLSNSVSTPQCSLASSCLPQGYTNQWACKVSGKVDCEQLSQEKLPCSSPSVTPVPSGITPTPPSGKYALDDTKLFQTYAVFFFNQPNFNSDDDIYDIVASIDPSFPNDSIKTSEYFAPGSMHFGSPGNLVDIYYHQFTQKGIAFQSLANHWSFYQCGKTLYWKVVDYPGHYHTQTYSNVIDCGTKVGAFSGTGASPLNWYIYYPYINGYTDAVSPGEPYNSTMDANGDGTINWIDYLILSMNTKMRAGGWEPPE